MLLEEISQGQLHFLSSMVNNGIVAFVPDEDQVTLLGDLVPLGLLKHFVNDTVNVFVLTEAGLRMLLDAASVTVN